MSRPITARESGLNAQRNALATAIRKIAADPALGAAGSVAEAVALCDRFELPVQETVPGKCPVCGWECLATAGRVPRHGTGNVCRDFCTGSERLTTDG